MSNNIAFGRNLRADAAWVLFQILESGKSSRECLPAVLATYSSVKDKKWLNECVQGALRTLPTLQFWLRPKLNKPLKGAKKIIEHVLLVGLYQLAYMRVSEHAAINETVNACSLFKAHGLKGLVNAILREFQRFPIAEPDDEILRSGMPKWLFKAITTAYPTTSSQILQNMNSKAPIWLRINTQKIDIDTFCQHLVNENISFEKLNNLANALIVNGVSVTMIPGFSEGHFAVQDGAAQQAAWLMQPENTDHILDACSAPGGKACHLYDLAPQASIIALDSSAKRLQRVEENTARLGCKLNVICGDASQPESWWDGKHFDKILLDAPCSATGVIRRHPDIRWLRKKQDIEQLVGLQQEMLRAVWSLLKPGGRLVYSTCSILPQENNEQIDAFISATADANRDMPDLQILPGEQQMDGFYYSRLIKS